MNQSPAVKKSNITIAVEQVASKLETLYDEYNITEHIECKKGCYYCCHQIVTISVFEAIRLGEQIVKLDAAELKRIRKSAERNSKVNNRIKIDSERWSVRLPCPLLKDGICSQYEVRPIVCQVANSNSREECKKLYEEKSVRGCEVQEVSPAEPDGVSNEKINMELIQVVNSSCDNFPKRGDFHKYALHVDMDKLLLYLCANTTEQRNLRVKNLIDFDMKTLKKLKKKSMNLQEYEHVYNVKIE
jgi:Fe-S-cluster containining protein